MFSSTNTTNFFAWFICKVVSLYTGKHNIKKLKSFIAGIKYFWELLYRQLWGEALSYKNFPFSSLLPIYLFYLSSCLYSLISFLTVFSQFFPSPFLFSSFLLLCHSAFYRVLSLLHLAPLKVYASAAAWHLWVERRQCPLQDSRTTESEASNKWIGSNSLSLRLQQQDSGIACLENSSSPECSFPCFGNFCCHSCSFSGLTLCSLFPEFYGNFCVLWLPHSTENPQITPKALRKNCK